MALPTTSPLPLNPDGEATYGGRPEVAGPGDAAPEATEATEATETSDGAIVTAKPGLPTVRPHLPSFATSGVTSGGLPTSAPALPTIAPVNSGGAVPAQGSTPVANSATTGGASSQQAQRAQQAGYQSVGALSADQLLYGSADQFDHLNDKIVRLREWLQDHLTNSGKAEAVAAARLDPAKRAEMSKVLDRLLVQYLSKETIVRGPDRATVVAAVINEVLGLGPIEPLWNDDRIEEVMVNGPGTVYAEVSGKSVPVPGAKFRDREQLVELCNQILMPLNRRVDQKSPLADGRLPDGSRVSITHHAVMPGGPMITIRRFPKTVWTLRDLVENGSMTPEIACELAFLINHKCSTLVVGGTGSGKTSLLNALSSAIPRAERILTIEDALELRFHPAAHVGSLEARPASASGEGEVTMRMLLKHTLRNAPKRIIFGEVRDGAALDMLQAMNTGHEGSMTTVHANGAEEAMNRLAVLVAQGGDVPTAMVNWLISDALDIFVVQAKFEDGSRRVRGVYEVPSMQDSTDGRLRPIPLYEWERTGTDANGKFTGHYVKRNEVSEHLRRARSLDQYEPFTIDDVWRMSELPVGMQKGA